MKTRSKSAPMVSAIRSRGTISRGDRSGAKIWIEATLDTIALEGADSLRIERLARKIGVSKGSFYWFFSNLDDLRFRALDHWKVHFNDIVFDRVGSHGGPLTEKLNLLVDAIFARKLGRYDAAIRSWSLRDANVGRFIQEIDATRLAFLQDLFSGLAGSEFKAHLFYRALIAESYIRRHPQNQSANDYLKSVASKLAQSDL